MNLKREFQVGVLFLVGLLLLVVFSITISRLEVFNQYYYLKVVFREVSGLKKGDPVQVSGLELGSVHALKLREDDQGTKIRVILKMRKEITLYEDYEIWIEESSMIGGNYVYIKPGTPGKRVLPKGTRLKGFLRLTGLEKLGQIVEENETEVRDLLEKANQIIKKVEQGEGSLGKLINDEELYINLKESSESLKKITKQIEEGEGLLGKLVFDKKLAEQIAQAGDAAVKMLEPVVKTKVYAGIETKYYAESKMSVSKAYISIYPRESRYFLIGVSALSLDKDGEVDFEDKITKDKDQTFWKVDLQLAYRYALGKDNFFTFRTGLLEGKLGAGLDFELPVTTTGVIPLMITLETRDAYNSVSEENIDENITAGLFRLYATTKLGKYFRLYAGYNRLFNSDPEFMAGICFQYLDEDIKNFVTLIGLSQ